MSGISAREWEMRSWIALITTILLIVILVLLVVFTTIRRFTILEYQRGLFYSRGKFVRLLESGDYWYFRPLQFIQKMTCANSM